jgi:hypothetical protein
METAKQMTTEPAPVRRPRFGQVLVGLALMLVGLGFLMHRLDVWHVHLSARFWPLILLVIGAAKFLDGPVENRDGRSRRGGMWLIYIGVWGLISEFELFGLSYDTSWPLLVIALGLNIVWRAVEETRARTPREQ